MGGPYTPRSLAYTNWNNNSFDFSDQSRASFIAELSWGIKLFTAGPTSFFLSEGLAYSNMTLRVPARLTNSAGGNPNVTLHLFALDSRIMQAWETCPLPRLIPFWEGGVQYTLYNQTGASDLVAAEGSAASFVAGLGFRFWLNRPQSLDGDHPGRYHDIPLFLTVKGNHIFPNNAGFDPGNTTALAGITAGL
jgi:hypothetical protein